MRQMTARIFAILALVALAMRPEISAGGPSYNSDREELDKTSREAGSALQEGMALYHSMLAALEKRDLSAAKELKAKTLDKYGEAVERFKTLAQLAPKQSLVIEKVDKLQAEAISRLKDRLRARDQKFPETEKDLANLGVKGVSDLAEILQKSDFAGDTKDYAAYLKLTLENSYVNEVGVFVSIVWTTHTR